MDEEVLEIVQKYPDLIYKFDMPYRQVLAKTYISGIETSYMNKTQEAASIYNAIKALGVKHTSNLMMEYLDINMSTLTRRLHMAREAGLIKTKEK